MLLASFDIYLVPPTIQPSNYSELVLLMWARYLLIAALDGNTVAIYMKMF